MPYYVVSTKRLDEFTEFETIEEAKSELKESGEEGTFILVEEVCRVYRKTEVVTSFEQIRKRKPRGGERPAPAG